MHFCADEMSLFTTKQRATCKKQVHHGAEELLQEFGEKCVHTSTARCRSEAMDRGTTIQIQICLKYARARAKIANIFLKENQGQILWNLTSSIINTVFLCVLGHKAVYYVLFNTKVKISIWNKKKPWTDHRKDLSTLFLGCNGIKC
jgi:hypothetical protein